MNVIICNHSISVIHKVQRDATTNVRGMGEAGTTRNREAEREAESRRRASNFLQAMENHGGAQPGETTEEETTRRQGKEPAPAETQAAEVLTPPKHKAQQHTPPTRPYGGAGPPRFRQTTPGRDRGTSTTTKQVRIGSGKTGGPTRRRECGLRQGRRRRTYA